MYVVFDRRGWNRGFCEEEYNGRFLIHERILRLCVFLICENHYPSRQASPGLELVPTPVPSVKLFSHHSCAHDRTYQRYDGN